MSFHLPSHTCGAPIPRGVDDGVTIMENVGELTGRLCGATISESDYVQLPTVSHRCRDDMKSGY